MASVLQEEEEKFVCAIPTLDMLKTDESLKILETHKWTLVESKASGQDGILLRIVCKNCGLHRISIISDIEDSVKRARDCRERLNMKEVRHLL